MKVAPRASPADVLGIRRAAGQSDVESVWLRAECEQVAVEPVDLSRNAYSALKELIKAGGDPARVPAFTRAPHFANDPQSIANALALFNRIFK
ncbi:hypothetical protein ABIA33_005691 [Streptacidiphilus sp. MAP12-16]|uniref:hypothetical protein n=1 Tax=Streptacidiphilus sp. MAP12-16 TaxID=3156300 RepID=UPI0035194B7D